MNVKCFNCGVVHNTNFCPNCGAPARPQYPNCRINNQRTRISGVTVGLIVTLSIVGVFFLFLLIVIVSSSFFSSESNSFNNTTIEQSDFQRITGVNRDQEEEIMVILNDCGIEVSHIAHDELLDDMNMDGETGYRISTEDVENIILYLDPDNNVNMIRYADNDLYVNSQIVSTLSDYVLSWDEQSDLQISCEHAIESILKSPSTAKFPNITKWNMWKEDGKIYIQSYVDAQNSFGAEIRSDFQFILAADDYNVESLIFDGEEYIND